MILTRSQLALLIIAASFVFLAPLAWFGYIPDLVVGLISVPLALFLPMLCGLGVIPTSIDEYIERLGVVPALIMGWLVGMISMLAIALVMYAADAFTAITFGLLCVLVAGVGMVRLFFARSLGRILGFRYDNLAVLIGGMVPVLVYRSFTGFPGSYSVVVFRFNYLAELMIQRNLVDLATGTSYLPMVQLVFAATGTLLGLDTFVIFWAFPFALSALYALGLYLLFRTFQIEKSVAIVIAVMGPLTLPWNIHFLYPPLFDVQPRTVAAVLFPYAICFVDKLADSKDHRENTANLLIFAFGYLAIAVPMLLSVHPEISNRLSLVLPVTTVLLAASLLGTFVGRSYGKLRWLWEASGFLLLGSVLPTLHLFESSFYALAIAVYLLVKISRNLSWSPAKYEILFGGLTCGYVILALAWSSGVESAFATVFPSFTGDYNPLGLVGALIQTVTIPVGILAIIGLFAGLTHRSRLMPIRFVFYVLIVIYLLPIVDIVRSGAALIPVVLMLCASAIGLPWTYRSSEGG